MRFGQAFKNSLIIAAKDNDFRPKLIRPIAANDLNKNGYSIFFTVQGFKNNRRITENLTNINAWAIDLDKGTKEEQLNRLKASPLPPTFIVETKNGHHAYWLAKDATTQNFEKIMRHLVERFNADKNAKDLCRVLRLPNFYHWKNPNDPFLVKTIFRSERSYTEKEMLFFFPERNKPEKQTKKTIPFFSNKKLDFEDINNAEALLAISGTSHVNGDIIELKQNSNGTQQIHVNGKSTACWIDKHGKIGSHDKGGPTLFQWINWYVKDGKETARIIRELFSK